MKITDLDLGCSHVAVVLTKDERLYNNYENENEKKEIKKEIISEEKINKPIKRRTDNYYDENNNNNNLNKNEDDFPKLKKYGIREEYITLNIKDRPKTKSKLFKI